MLAANDNADGKNCSKCLEWKLLAEFHTAKRKDGSLRFVAACKVCTNAANRRHAAANVAAAVERVRQWRLLPGNMERKNAGERARRKDPETAAKNAEYNAAWKDRPGNRDRINKRRRARLAGDPAYRAKLLARQREYYGRPEIKRIVSEKGKLVKSTPEWKDWFNARRRERYATDPDFFCAVKCRGFVVRTAKKAKTNKSENTATSLGYTPGQLRQRIECQFKPGMSWDNHGAWHIDHKKPIAAFLAQGITDPRTINALCNLQPMWGEENQKKSSAWPAPVAANDNSTADRKAA